MSPYKSFVKTKTVRNITVPSIKGFTIVTSRTDPQWNFMIFFPLFLLCSNHKQLWTMARIGF